MKSQIFNPYLPLWEYIPDGEPRVFGDRLYLFGSHDRFNGNWFCENDYVAWSAPLADLSAWRCEGVIYRRDQDSRPGNLYAPDVVQGGDGRYYLYYSKDDTSVIGVAVCETPAGKYRFLGEVHYPDGRVAGDSEGEYFLFDPSVLTEGGRVWLYAGSSARRTTTGIKRRMAGCTVTELEPDMVTVKTPPRLILPGTRSWNTDAFFEGPSARKIGDTYYLCYPVRNGTGMHYATSRFPDRDFVHRGVIHSVSGIGIEGHTRLNPLYPMGNEHGGMVNLQGQWYLFSHRQTNNHGFSRQGVAEPITILPDGSIPQVVPTSCGLNGGPLRDSGPYPASIACVLMSKRWLGKLQIPRRQPYVTQSGQDGDKQADFYIARIRNGCTVGYRYFDFAGGDYGIGLTLRKGDGAFEVGTESGPIGRVAVRKSDRWQSFFAKCHIPAGTHSLFFTYHGKGSAQLLQFNLEKMEAH